MDHQTRSNQNLAYQQNNERKTLIYLARREKDRQRKRHDVKGWRDESDHGRNTSTTGRRVRPGH